MNESNAALLVGVMPVSYTGIGLATPLFCDPISNLEGAFLIQEYEANDGFVDDRVTWRELRNDGSLPICYELNAVSHSWGSPVVYGLALPDHVPIVAAIDTLSMTISEVKSRLFEFPYALRQLAKLCSSTSELNEANEIIEELSNERVSKPPPVLTEIMHHIESTAFKASEVVMQGFITTDVQSIRRFIYGSEIELNDYLPTELHREYRKWARDISQISEPLSNMQVASLTDGVGTLAGIASAYRGSAPSIELFSSPGSAGLKIFSSLDGAFKAEEARWEIIDASSSEVNPIKRQYQCLQVEVQGAFLDLRGYEIKSSDERYGISISVADQAARRGFDGIILPSADLMSKSGVSINAFSVGVIKNIIAAGVYDYAASGVSANKWSPHHVFA